MHRDGWLSVVGTALHIATIAMSSRFFINLSTGMLLIVMITSFCAIFKPYETSSEISGGLSVGDLIGAEVGGTMGIMIRDDHPVEGADAGIIIANHTTAGSPVRVRSFLFL